MIFRVISRLQSHSSWTCVLYSKRCSFHEFFKSGDRKYEVEPEKKPLSWHFKNGLQIIKSELKLVKGELKDYVDFDRKMYSPGDTDILWKFNSKEEIDKWVVTSDKSNNDGYSDCELTLTKYNHGLFKGVIDTRLPKDGRIVRTGYCNITTKPPKKSFRRESYFEWEPCTHLVFRVRGDGRSYAIVLLTGGTFDLTWFDAYTFILYTRGGPYWQYVKLPFSKFFLTSRGRIQDTQGRLYLNRIKGLGITCADQNTGPFQLEIDYIGLHWDLNHLEEFAYEMYHTPKLGLTF